MSDTEAIAKRIVANAHRIDYSVSSREVLLEHVVELARAYLEMAARDIEITFDWLATFCRIENDTVQYKFVSFRQRSDKTWDCWVTADAFGFGVIHLGNGFRTRGDVYDLLNGMKIPLKGA